MITIASLKPMLEHLGFTTDSSKQIFCKNYPHFDCSIIVDFINEKITYPIDKGLIVNDLTTCNLSKNENFVVLECIVRLLDKGYRPEHIELERKWQLGLDPKGGKSDICVLDAEGKNILFIVECKTYGQKYNEALSILKNDGGQLFSYWQQEKSTKFLVLYASDFVGSKIVYKCESVNCEDDANILLLAKKDDSILLYKNSSNKIELHECWKETYDQQLNGDVVFDDDTQAYNIGLRPLRKGNLVDFTTEDRIVNKFEEILRHNNVSDKENAFNRLTALFICKLVDEINKKDEDIVDFQYKNGSDTYEILQDRLQKLHQQGMDEFMEEKTFYIADDYAEKVVQQYTGSQRKKLIDELNKTLRILKFYTNNDFAFKDVHNEELFYQNGKVLVEVVQLFQKFRIINSNNLQLLGDLFEQLLNKGFKQNEGQFFTPVPVTRFIAKSLPIESLMVKEGKQYYPKVIDYACGAGHFLTETFEEIGKIAIKNNFEISPDWIDHKLFGIEKDYRLARVSKIMLFMHGMGKGNIIFGDGLESYPDKEIENDSFDILVANPPYSVSAFKPHLKLRNNTEFSVLEFISNDGSEIETMFVERIAQLIKSQGIAAVILPSTILNKNSRSYIAARDSIIKNFNIKAIVQMGKKTFGATGTPTVILFLEKYQYPPKREDLVFDSIATIFSLKDTKEWEDNEILCEYCKEIKVSVKDYLAFIKRKDSYKAFDVKESYFYRYFKTLTKSAEYKAKIAQKSYKSASAVEKEKMINQIFYNAALEEEKEKLSVFAFVYKQKTLVVISPDDNDEQERFLGYSWSNRKGQEGIVIKRFGGYLFDDNDDSNPDRIAFLINNFFKGSIINSDRLSAYYFYSDLKYLFDFESEKFDKSIRLVEKRELKTDPDYKLYKLSQDDLFDLRIGKRVLKEELVDSDTENAIPVRSANVKEDFGYINKSIVDDYSRPSIVWGIDGNWIVNYIPKDEKFYPTDHCGYLRVLTNKILPEYMRYVLEVEGRYQRFSRSNRASIGALKKITFQAPGLAKQQLVIDELAKYDANIEKLEKEIADKEAEILNNFSSKFDKIIPDTEIEKYFDVSRGTTITEGEANIDGDIPVVAGGKTMAYFHDVSNRPGNIITVSASGSSGYVNYWDKPIFASDCNTILSLDEEVVSTLYLYYFLKARQNDVYALKRGLQPSHVYADDLKKFKFPFPHKDSEKKFLAFVVLKKNEIAEIKKNIEKIKGDKRLAVDKYFK